MGAMTTDSLESEVLEIAEGRRLISDRGQEIREGARISRLEAGKAVGAGQTTIWRWETGQRTPRGEAARRYGHLLRQLDKVAQSDG